MIHPASELRFISAEIGHGVFATTFIPRGTLVWVFDEFDRVLTPSHVHRLPPLLGAVVAKYGYVRADGNTVLCWDLGRYMNHACAPTSRDVGDALVVAVRDIAADDELTCDYGSLNLSEPMVCRCGAATCRGVVRGDDPLRHYERWDEEARAAFAVSPSVPQPLLPFANVGVAELPLLDAVRNGTVAENPSARESSIPRDGAE